MSADTVRRVDGVVYGEMVALNRTLNEAMKPGECAELTSDDKFQKHSVAGGALIPVILRKDFGQGKEVTDEVASGNRGFGFIPQVGETAWVRLADGENATRGDYLESAGNGRFQVYASATTSSTGGTSVDNASVKVMALESVSLTDSSGAETENDTFIRVLRV